MSEHDNNCDYNNSSLCARALLHDFPVRCTCGVDEHNQREREERRRRVFASKCSCTWTKRVSWSGALCPPCAALTTLASNLAIGVALCRAWQQGLRDGVNMTSGYTTCGDGGSYCSDECEQAKECIL